MIRTPVPCVDRSANRSGTTGSYSLTTVIFPFYHTKNKVLLMFSPIFCTCQTVHVPQLNMNCSSHKCTGYFLAKCLNMYRMLYHSSFTDTTSSLWSLPYCLCWTANELIPSSPTEPSFYIKLYQWFGYNSFLYIHTGFSSLLSFSAFNPNTLA